MIGAPAEVVQPPNLLRWKVFIQDLSNGSRTLGKDEKLLYRKT